MSYGVKTLSQISGELFNESFASFHLVAEASGTMQPLNGVAGNYCRFKLTHAPIFLGYRETPDGPWIASAGAAWLQRNYPLIAVQLPNQWCVANLEMDITSATNSAGQTVEMSRYLSGASVKSFCPTGTPVSIRVFAPTSGALNLVDQSPYGVQVRDANGYVTFDSRAKYSKLTGVQLLSVPTTVTTSVLANSAFHDGAWVVVPPRSGITLVDAFGQMTIFTKNYVEHVNVPAYQLRFKYGGGQVHYGWQYVGYPVISTMQNFDSECIQGIQTPCDDVALALSD